MDPCPKAGRCHQKIPIMTNNDPVHANDVPTYKHSIRMDELVRLNMRKLTQSLGVTYNVALHALLNNYDARGDQTASVLYATSYDPGPTRDSSVKVDDETYKRFLDLAADLRTTTNVAMAVLLKTYADYGGPIRIEGAGLRIPCPIEMTCAPDAPSGGPVNPIHTNPTRLAKGMTADVQPAKRDVPGRKTPETAKPAAIPEKKAPETAKPTAIEDKKTELMTSIIGTKKASARLYKTSTNILRSIAGQDDETPEK